MTSSPPETAEGLSYRAAGVDIDAGNRVVERIKPLVARTHRPGVLSSLGGFGALFELPPGRFREPVLVSGTDGVGTKLQLAQRWNRHDQIGIDLVAMCVNDVLVQGAEPLFFLDYFATGRLNEDTAVSVIGGIARGCELAGCALIGGETAEMPDMYPPDEYDLAGFCVGAVEKSLLLDGSRVQDGDVLLGIASSGAHSNGYSLIRKIVDRSGLGPEHLLAGRSLADWLLEPTCIYVKSLLPLIAQKRLHALAHITGGGLTENILRVIPESLAITVDGRAWPRSALFDWLQHSGPVSELELRRTFNCGIGMVLVLPEDDCAGVQQHLASTGFESWPIGAVERTNGERLRYSDL